MNEPKKQITRTITLNLLDNILKMKRPIFLISVLVCALQFSFNAQTNKKTIPPSDAATGFTYDLEKAVNLIVNRLVDPSISNQDVKLIIDEPSFPKLNNGEKIDSDYTKKISKWVEKNPNLIISTLKNRKDVVYAY